MNNNKKIRLAKVAEKLGGSPDLSTRLFTKSLDDLQSKISQVKHSIPEVPNIDPVIESIYRLQEQLGLISSRFTTFEKTLNQKVADIINLVEDDKKSNAELSQELSTENNNNLTEESKKIKKDLESKIEDLRTFFIANRSSGGNMNRKISVNGTDILTRYTDLNLKGSGVTYSAVNNNTTKQVDLTLTASGGGGADFSLFRYVHLQTGVTGTGTTGDPYLGFDTVIEASTGGENWLFIDAYFQTDGTELLISAANVSLVGSGRGTVLRSTHSTAAKATVRFMRASSADMFGVRLAHMTLDGNGATKYGIFADNTLNSLFEDIEYINHVDWCFIGTRGIDNYYSNWNAWGSRMSTVTTNGYWFGSTVSSISDHATTVSSMQSLYVNGLSASGIGFKMSDAVFGNVFTGGSSENVGINLSIGSLCTGNIFNGTDFEESTGAGVQIDGAADQNIFNRCNFIATTVTISAGAGSNVFDNCVVNIVDNSTGYNRAINCNGSPSGTNTNCTQVINNGGNGTGISWNKSGVNVYTFKSTSGGVTGLDLFVQGDRISGIYSVPSVGMYLVDGGGLANYLAATILAAAAMKIAGQNVTVYGTLTSGNSAVSGTGVRSNTILSTDGAAAVMQLWSSASVLGYVVAEGTNIYISANGSLAYDHTTLESEYAIKISTAGLVRLANSELVAGYRGKAITQTSHGFVAGDVLRYNGTSYVKAKADSAANAEVVGMVGASLDANTFALVTVGYISGLSGLTAGTVYFLDPSTAGALTATETSTVGQVSKPIFVADSTTSGFFHNYRGLLIAANASIPIVLKDFFTDGGNTTTAETDLYTYTTVASQLANNGEKLQSEWGGVFVSSGTATRQIKMYFGGTAIFDTGALTLSLSSAWTMYAVIIRVSSTVIRYNISFTTEGAALSAYTASGELTGLTLSNTNILKITGTAAGVGAATNDIVAKSADIIWYPAAV